MKVPYLPPLMSTNLSLHIRAKQLINRADPKSAAIKTTGTRKTYSIIDHITRLDADARIVHFNPNHNTMGRPSMTASACIVRLVVPLQPVHGELEPIMIVTVVVRVDGRRIGAVRVGRVCVLRICVCRIARFACGEGRGRHGIHEFRPHGHSPIPGRRELRSHNDMSDQTQTPCSQKTYLARIRRQISNDLHKTHLVPKDLRVLMRITRQLPSNPLLALALLSIHRRQHPQGQ